MIQLIQLRSMILLIMMAIGVLILLQYQIQFLRLSNFILNDHNLLFFVSDLYFLVQIEVVFTSLLLTLLCPLTYYEQQLFVD